MTSQVSMQVSLLSFRDPCGDPSGEAVASFLSRSAFAHLPGWWDVRVVLACAFFSGFGAAIEFFEFSRSPDGVIVGY